MVTDSKGKIFDDRRKNKERRRKDLNVEEERRIKERRKDGRK